MRRHELTPEQWKRIEPHLPGKPGDPGRTAGDNQRFVNAVVWIARTGAPWRDLPERFGPWNSVFQRCLRWSKKGVWGRLLRALGGDPDLEHLLLDSTIVRAHQHAAGAKGGKLARRLDDRGAASAARCTSRSTVKDDRSDSTSPVASGMT
jgi:putative transposase